MKDLKLQPRLQAIADMVPQGAVLADIGSDHAYLPVYLLLQKRISRAIAGDVHPQPLERGRETARLYGVAQAMDFRLCDGLAAFAPGEADTVVIAGMGGETIAAILDGAPWVCSPAFRLLLQPMSKTEWLRQWLGENGYRLLRERLVRDRGSLYPIMEATGGQSPPLSQADLYGGVLLRDDPLAGEYLEQRIGKLLRAAEGLLRAEDPEGGAKARALREIAAQLQRRKEDWLNHADCVRD